MNSLHVPLPLHIDSTMITCFRSCPQKFRKEFVLGYRPPGISVDLHAGACFATGIEHTYRGFFEKGLPLRDALEFGHAAFALEWGDFQIPEFKRTAKTFDRVWEAVEGYFVKWDPRTDDVQPYFAADGKPTFEYTFAIPLEPCSNSLNFPPEDNLPGIFPSHPDGGPFLYCGRFDALGNRHGRPVVRDEKSTGRSIGDGWADQWNLRNQFMGYCVSGDTEVLTKFGWLPISLLEDGQAVAQWDRGQISFVNPSKVTREHYVGDMISVDGRIQLLATPNHRQLLLDEYDHKFKEFQLKDFPWSRGAARFITAGTRIDGQDIDKAFIQLLVATQADGYLATDSRAIRFGFTKQRKIDRMDKILRDLGVAFTRTVQGDGRTSFYLEASQETDIVRNYLGEAKEFGSWLLQWNGECLEFFIDELRYWDGCDYGTKILYATSNKICADWVETIAPLCGRYTSRQIIPVTTEQQEHYRITISSEIKKSVLRHTITNIPWNDMVYCVTVPSSFFLIRYKGKVLVTGNTWACKQAGIPIDTVVVRGIAILKTKIDYEECDKTFPDEMLDRWHEQLRRDLWRIRRAYDENYFDYNFADSCTAYGNCIFQDVCTSPPDQEASWLANFQVRRWDPLAKNPVKEARNG